MLTLTFAASPNQIERGKLVLASSEPFPKTSPIYSAPEPAPLQGTHNCQLAPQVHLSRFDSSYGSYSVDNAVAGLRADGQARGLRCSRGWTNSPGSITLHSSRNALSSMSQGREMTQRVVGDIRTRLLIAPTAQRIFHVLR